MLLAFDVGNSTVKVGLSTSDKAGWRRIWRFSSDAHRSADEWYTLLAPHLQPFTESGIDIATVGICSVVPLTTISLSALSLGGFGIEPSVIKSEATNNFITVGTRIPAETGADRVTNAAAAFARYRDAAIVVDLGTATKIDGITADGVLLGGAIAPGLGLGMESLAARAARLYAVPLTRPASAIGSDTVSAVQAGVVLGHISLVDGLIEEIARELGGVNNVVVTGGYADLIESSLSRSHDFSPSLTLDGIRLLTNHDRH